MPVDHILILKASWQSKPQGQASLKENRKRSSYFTMCPKGGATKYLLHKLALKVLLSLWSLVLQFASFFVKLPIVTYKIKIFLLKEERDFCDMTPFYLAGYLINLRSRMAICKNSVILRLMIVEFYFFLSCISWPYINRITWIPILSQTHGHSTKNSILGQKMSHFYYFSIVLKEKWWNY